MSTKILKDVAIAISLVVGTLFITGVATISLMLFLPHNHQDWFYLGTRIALLVSVMIIAYIYHLIFGINYRLTIERTQKLLFFKLLSFTIMLITTVVVLKDWSLNEIGLLLLSFFISAVAEELLFRGLVEYQLKKDFQLVFVIFVQAILFAFLGHQGFDWYSNLIVRLPLGIALSVLRHWTDSYSMAMAVHYAYNASVSLIF